MTSRRQATSAAPHILESVLAKIERVLPDSLRSEIQSLQSAVAFVPQPPAAHAPNEMTIFLSSAVQQQRCVQMRYRSKHEETERVLDPYGVVLHWEFWYVVGWCHLRQDLRVFRLDRILGVKLQKNTFKRPSDFVSLEYVLESLAKAPNSWAVEILLETTLKEAQRLIAPGVAVFEETTGGVLLRGQVERLEALARADAHLGMPLDRATASRTARCVADSCKRSASVRLTRVLTHVIVIVSTCSAGIRNLAAPGRERYSDSSLKMKGVGTVSDDQTCGLAIRPIQKRASRLSYFFFRSEAAMASAEDGITRDRAAVVINLSQVIGQVTRELENRQPD